MGDLLRAGKLSRYVTSHPDQLSLIIPLWVGTMSTSQAGQVTIGLASDWPCVTDNSGSLKRPRIGLHIGCPLRPALNCLVFLKKIAFHATDEYTDRRTDRQANRKTTSLRTASAFASRGLMIGQARYKLSGGHYIASVVSLQ